MLLHQIPPEILLMIARLLEDDDGGFCFADLNSLLKVNRTLYACLNRTLWQQAVGSGSTTERAFTHLIRTNDLTSLKFFLGLGADVETLLLEFQNECGADNYNYSDVKISAPTPLKVAAHLDIVPMARLLLEHGADVVQYDDLDRPSHSAIHAARSAEMVQLLLDHHADPEQQAVNEVKFRPLHYYAMRENIEAMRVVLRNGVEVDPDPTLNLPPPLHLAAERNIDAVKLLLEHGADVKKKGPLLNTPLHFATRAGKNDVVRLLVKIWPDGMRVKGALGHMPLHMAAMAGKTDVVRTLVESWPDGMREKNTRGNTPLHNAAGWRQTDVVRLLVGIEPNGMREKNKDGQTPLHFAAAAGDTEAVRVLVEGWPGGTREKDEYGNTPLHMAAATVGIEGSEEVVRLLVERWPEGKEALNEEGQTPLSVFECFGDDPGIDQRQRIIILLGGVN
jgi:ankyrin repeat protein